MKKQQIRSSQWYIRLVLTFLAFLLSITLLIWINLRSFGYQNYPPEPEFNLGDLIENNTGNTEAALVLATLVLLMALLGSWQLHRTRVR